MRFPCVGGGVKRKGRGGENRFCPELAWRVEMRGRDAKKSVVLLTNDFNLSTEHATEISEEGGLSWSSISR